MKLKIFTLFLTTLLIFIFQSTGFSETFKIMTEEYPPYNYTEDGKLTGLSSEVVRALLTKVNHPDNIEVLPWSRSYNLIQKKSGYILFSTTRTEARENMFKWVGPLAPNTWCFYAKKGSGIKINSLEEAKKIGAIGTYKEDACELFLKEKGFTNIDSIVDDNLNPKKLIAGRIDLWIIGDVMGMHKARKQGLGDKIEKIFDIKTTQLYIAFSKETSDDVINKWQAALDELKADGTYDKILSKYL